MRPRCRHLAAALLLLPAAARAGGPATKTTQPPVANLTNCATSPLRFAPIPGARYAIGTWDGNSPADNRGAYRSTIVFSRQGSNGWTAEESDFRKPFAEPAASGMADARLVWQLDERGLPTSAPEVRGRGNPDVVRNLSLFAFRPMGLTTRSTRASPFALYIAAMHRQIHSRFTLAFLADIDARKDPTYAEQSLWTMLAIVVNGDGTIARLDVVRPSGVRAFDDAALASVRSAAPFPPAPSVIESGDGKVHLDWEFHRDAVRGCGTPGVRPYILDSVGQ
jgi:TonB family protein